MSAAQGLAWRLSAAKSMSASRSFLSQLCRKATWWLLAAGAGRGGDSGGRGQRAVVGEAGAAVADLGQQQGGAVGAGAGQAGEDRGVVVQGESLGDPLVEHVDAGAQVDQRWRPAVR